MNALQSYHQFLSGMHKIEMAIIERTRAVDPRNFYWHRGRPFLPPPSAIELQIKVGEKKLNAILSREQIADSAERIARPDVAAFVRALATELARQPRSV
jgi:hypothetical protein